MENASKALLIAASVLIVILLIALGMGIYNNSAGTAASDAASTAKSISSQSQMATYNQYIGTSIAGAQVSDLLTKLNGQTAISVAFNYYKTTTATKPTKVTDPATAVSLVKFSSTYTVEPTASASGGYSSFTITENR